MSVPMYIAESAPAHMRGKLVVLNLMFITGGQFVATLIDGSFSAVNEGWRYKIVHLIFDIMQSEKLQLSTSVDYH